MTGVGGAVGDARKRTQDSTDHGWPTNPGEHLWGPWLTQTRTTQYRVCVHPDCRAVQERVVPNA